MERGQIVALATVVIPPENTPQKTRSEYLTAHPTWKYIGPADVIKFEWQIGRWGWAGFAGETARKYKTYSQPASMELKEFTTSLPSISLSPLSPSDDPYDCEIWFKDKFSDLRVIVENCVKIPIEVPEPPPSDIADWDFVATPGTYDLGASVPFNASYKYKGKAQSGWLTISLGTGIYPTFSTKYTYPKAAVSFEEAMDWASRYLTGNFILPTTLVRGQTYSVRAKLETADGAQETDTDWGVITISEAVAGFTLKLKNVPAGAALWKADFAENSFAYDPMADSGWLSIGKVWSYPSDPRGCTTLRIIVIDASYFVLLEVHNLGPVNAGKNYVFDCPTGILTG